MLVLNAGVISSGINHLVRLEIIMRSTDGWLDKEGRREFYAGRVLELWKQCEHLGMTASWKKAREIHVMLTKTIPTFTNEGATIEMKRCAEGLRENIHYELEGRNFYGPLAGYEKYYDQVELFGKDVFDKFGSANEDIYEAGMCLALERGTACVMHLMRVHEVGLKALAAAVGVGNQNDWGGYLREVHEALDKRAKSAGARSELEQFYSETAASFDRLKRAYRNPTMHPEKSYSPERAEQILLATKDFMGVLATRISETP